MSNNTLKQIEPIEKRIKFEHFSIEYDNLNSAEQIISGVANFHPSKFISNGGAPFIIDSGSNIGISALFFKTLYPKARLLCFEPDPHAFQILQANMQYNKIKDTTLVNAAISNKVGEIDFFGQIFVNSPDARGNSIIDAWGLQRTINNTTRVKSVKLSAYIHSKVDFLKLNIEGAEQQVIEDLDQAGKLPLIEEIAVEVHYSETTKHINDLDTITSILKKNAFSVEVIEKDKSSRLPQEIKNWVKKTNPRFFSVKAIKL
jgi:FkbM family methyltransferase